MCVVITRSSVLLSASLLLPLFAFVSSTVTSLALLSQATVFHPVSSHSSLRAHRQVSAPFSGASLHVPVTPIHPSIHPPIQEQTSKPVPLPFDRADPLQPEHAP